MIAVTVSQPLIRLSHKLAQAPADLVTIAGQYQKEAGALDQSISNDEAAALAAFINQVREANQPDVSTEPPVQIWWVG